MTKESKSLSVKEISSELLARVNAKAALQGTDQPTFVIEALEEATKDLLEIQGRVKRERESRIKKAPK
jgi:predicted DNA binding CopG/RHH family protein